MLKKTVITLLCLVALSWQSLDAVVEAAVEPPRHNRQTRR
jgi:hypothetical protein